jgi:peptide chain release factor 2
VRITHLPTKTVITCQNERSQQQNKETALTILKSRLQQRAEEKRRAEEAQLRGESLPAEWGSQIRSYVMQPYKMVKDHRSAVETQDVGRVLDGDLSEFVEGYLRWNKKK